MSTKGYELNEEDIEATIRFLKTIDPEHATPEMAIALLEHFQAEYHELGHKDPEKLVEMFYKLKQDSKEYTELLKKLKG